MDINHIHFYVDEANWWSQWFTQRMGFQAIARYDAPHTRTVAVSNGQVHLLLSSPLAHEGPVFRYLQRHPPGVADVAFRVTSLADIQARMVAVQAPLQAPLQSSAQVDGATWLVVQGWGDIQHTLIEAPIQAPVLPLGDDLWVHRSLPSYHAPWHQAVEFSAIDHVVLNVAQGDLAHAIRHYEALFGFQRQQSFAIHTAYSGLFSQVLTHPLGTAQLPINEPTSPRSQIQEFLDVNRGPGVQHVALHTPQLLRAIAQLRRCGLSFLTVPTTYYEQLRHRPGFQIEEALWTRLAQQEVLVDWQLDAPQALLLQTFTHPVFGQPTFFFEVIERQVVGQMTEQQQVQGFGEGNFRALFEAIEREQLQRGSKV